MLPAGAEGDQGSGDEDYSLSWFDGGKKERQKLEKLVKEKRRGKKTKQNKGTE